MLKIALLDCNNIVTEIQEVADLQDTVQALMLELDDYVDITGKKVPEVTEGYKLQYDRESGLFLEIEYSEPVDETTEQELIQAELLLNQVDIIMKQNEQDEVLAEILLNQMEV